MGTLLDSHLRMVRSGERVAQTGVTTATAEHTTAIDVVVVGIVA